MSGVRMRLRTDPDILAEFHAHYLRGKPPVVCPCGEPGCGLRPENYLQVPPAEPGDTWRVRWHREDGPLAGYAICCPKCREIHLWCSSRTCGSKRDRGDGVRVCDHHGVGSCWTWSGSAEDGTLSASPSLYAETACGWHGHLTHGELVGA